MPKDARKNIDRYKIQGGHLNEFEFHQNQGQVKEPATVGKAATTDEAAAVWKQAAKPTQGATAKTLAAKKATTQVAKKAGKKAAKKAAKKVAKKAGTKTGKKAAKKTGKKAGKKKAAKK